MPDFITIKEGMYKLAEMGVSVTHNTLVKWIKAHDMGSQPGGRKTMWYLNSKKFDSFIAEQIQGDGKDV